MVYQCLLLQGFQDTHGEIVQSYIRLEWDKIRNSHWNSCRQWWTALGGFLSHGNNEHIFSCLFPAQKQSWASYKCLYISLNNGKNMISSFVVEKFYLEFLKFSDIIGHRQLKFTSIISVRGWNVQLDLFKNKIRNQFWLVWKMAIN